MKSAKVRLEKAGFKQIKVGAVQLVRSRPKQPAILESLCQSGLNALIWRMIQLMTDLVAMWKSIVQRGLPINPSNLQQPLSRIRPSPFSLI